MTMLTPDLYAEPYPALRVGMCQVATEPWDIAGNLERTLAALDSAASAGAELAITPECVLHGYAPIHTPEFLERSRAAAVAVEGPEVGAVRDRARALGTDVVLGFAERGPGGAVRNSAAFIGRDGDVRAVYSKVHCRDFEDAARGGIFTPGGAFHVVPVERRGATFRIGMMICFDREVPETVRCLRALGAEFIACPLATNTWRLDAPGTHADNEMITRIRAAENEVFIAVVNHARTFNGGSFIVGPGGQCLGQMDGAEGVRVVEVPVGVVPARFHANPLGWAGWGFRRPEIYRKYLEV